MFYADDTPLTPEIIEKLIPKLPKSNDYINSRGIPITLQDYRQQAYLGVSRLGVVSVEDDKHWLVLTENIQTLGRLRMLCAALEIPLDESRLMT